MKKLNEKLVRKLIANIYLLKEEVDNVLSEMIDSDDNESEQLTELMMLNSLIADCNEGWNTLFHDFFSGVSEQKEDIKIIPKSV